MLLGVSGSVAAIKAAEVAALLAAWADVRMVTTEVGRRFVKGPLPPGVALYGAPASRAREPLECESALVCGQAASLVPGVHYWSRALLMACYTLFISQMKATCEGKSWQCKVRAKYCSA